MTQDTTSTVTAKPKTEPADTNAGAAAAPSTTSTKWRSRIIYTVTRIDNSKQSLADLRDTLNMVTDEAGEFLYGGMGVRERIDVRLELWDKPNKRWIPMK
jgi:hypothetical protein